MDQAILDHVHWRLEQFPHLKKKTRMTALVTLKNLVRNLQCLWGYSRDLHDEASSVNHQEETWGNQNLHLRTTRNEPVTSARNRVITLLIVLAGERNQRRRNTRMTVLMTQRRRRNLQNPHLQSPPHTRRLVSERLGHLLARKWIPRQNQRNVMKRRVLMKTQNPDRLVLHLQPHSSASQSSILKKWVHHPYWWLCWWLRSNLLLHGKRFKGTK